MGQHRYTVVDELRESTRFVKEPGYEVAVIWRTPGEGIQAEVHDESLGGLGLIIDELAGFTVGAEAEVVYQSTLLHGIVRHIEPQEDGRFLLGFECEGLTEATD